MIKLMTVAALSASLAAAPAFAATSPATSLSLAQSPRAAAPTDKGEKLLEGRGALIVGILAAGVIAGGIIAVADDDDSDSN